VNAPTDETPLGEVRAWLRGRVEDGETCPCCLQFAKIYRRKITAPMARVLIAMWRVGGRDWVDIPALAKSIYTDRTRATGGDETKARYWGLIEPKPNERRDDGSLRVGWWRLTHAGVSFVRGENTVPKYARIYDGRLLGLDYSEHVDITDALGTRFDYRELMQGA
jgi:hypothetical protein